MATRAERFRAAEAIEQSHRKGGTRPTKAASKVHTKKAHNLGARAGRSATVKYETAIGGATRKSTRGSAHRQRATSNLERAKQAEKITPDARARRAKSRAVKVRGKS
jgi:hypothetical protein